MTKTTVTAVNFETETAPLSTKKQRKSHTRLSDEQKAEIRALLATGMKQTEIAEKFGCTSVTVSNIKRNYTTLKPRTTTTTKAPTPVTDHTIVKAKVFVG
jgi:DNA invertase Pin-like site-specific DNA recombinase